MDTAGGYEDFPFVAEYYDYVHSYAALKDTDFFVGFARKAFGPVLELACGTGRVLIPTAKAGIEIVGLDLSEPMLSACRRKLSKEAAEVQARVQLVHADMRRFDLKRRFALAMIPFRSFQLLTEIDDQLSCLASVHRHLQDDCRLVLDLFNPHMPWLAGEPRKEEYGDDPPVTMPDGRKVYMRGRNVRIDRPKQCIDVELIFYVEHPDGRKERLVHSFRVFYLFRYEAEHLLARSGFEVEHVYGDHEMNPFGTEEPGELILVARKRP
ncbi:MAG TPA: class I SAM-dependent methyltransferase [Acidobacteriota bacterium]|nr:class I SAM-dependent methyltransferase [Acidobacteriota bacterium]